MRGMLLAILALTGGCRLYNLESKVSDQAGLIPAEQFARYGTEQARAVAIGRALAQWSGGQSHEARAVQTTKAAEYARTLPGVRNVEVDTLGYRLTVIFESGWRAGILPIDDGIAPEATPGIAGN